MARISRLFNFSYDNNGVKIISLLLGFNCSHWWDKTRQTYYCIAHGNRDWRRSPRQGYHFIWRFIWWFQIVVDVLALATSAWLLRGMLVDQRSP